MIKKIEKFNAEMPPIFQIGVDDNNLNLYLVSFEKDKKDKNIQKSKSVRVLTTGTNKEIESFIDGMLATFDIARNFQDFEERLEEHKNGTKDKK